MSVLDRRAALPGLLLLVVAGHALLATVYVPVHSDIHVYRLYAGSVAKAIGDGTSAAVARDDILRGNARADGRPDPTASSLLIEYPPVAVLWMATAAIGVPLDDSPTPDADPYVDRFRLSMLLVYLLTLLILVKWAADTFASPANRERHAVWRIAVFATGSLILGNLLFDRLDLIVGALLLAGIVLLSRGRWLSAFLMLAIAINFKASPIALAPLWVIASLPVGVVARVRSDPGATIRASVKRSAVLAGVTLVVFLPFVIIEGTRALDFLRFRAIQGVHVESVAGSALLILQRFGLPLDVTATFGTFELQTPLSPVFAAASPVLLVVGAIAVLILYCRAVLTRGQSSVRETASPPSGHMSAPGDSLAAADPQAILLATTATLLLTLVTSKLLSPQYLLWVLPLVPLLEFRGVRARAFHLWFLLTCALTTVIFPYLLGRTLARQDPAGDGYLEPTLLGVGLVVARNLLLVWLAWLAIREFRPRPVANADDPDPIVVPLHERTAEA